MAGTETSVLVAGSGPAGMVAALLIADAGIPVTLAGPRPTATDRRTTALMIPSLDLLERIGVLDEVRTAGAPLEAMRIVDATGRLVRSPTVTFRASEIGAEHFGVNIPNARLTDILAAAIDARPAIEWREADGAAVSARLVAAADGRRSTARQAAGIETRETRLPQTAVVANVRHGRDHGGISTEFHTPSGPFTHVPLSTGRSSLVWVLSPGEAVRILALSDEDFAAEAEARMSSMLGKVTAEPGRQSYPLTSVSPSRFAARRIALVGEAAHVFPPIGAQGLNLGFRDADDLAQLSAVHSDDPGSVDALRRYDARRRADITARSGAVNLLNRSLLSDMLPAQMARAVGLAALGTFSPLRGFFMREGLRPGSGFGAIAGSLGKKVRRQQA